jgi:hypothetical protein
MSRAKDLTRLAEVAQLMLDHRLGRLRDASAQLDRSRMQLLAINRAAGTADLPLAAAGKVALAYDRWADVRRAELNLVIARQTAEMLEARSDAGIAFGRLQALQGLSRRSKDGR